MAGLVGEGQEPEAAVDWDPVLSSPYASESCSGAFTRPAMLILTADIGGTPPGTKTSSGHFIRSFRPHHILGSQ